MSYVNSDALVSTQWLADHMNAPDVHIVDATWFLPNSGRDPRAEFEQQHIPGAVFFDVDGVVDSNNPLPHMLPSPEKFSSAMRELGLGDGNRIVVYDTTGTVMAAHRVWWTIRVFGHEDVAVLDGGLGKWVAEGRPVEDMAARLSRRHFTSHVNNTLVRSREQILHNLETGREQVIDVRSAGRFNGTEPEPREGLRSGRIPGSMNLPFQKVLDMDNHGTMRPAAELKVIFEESGLDLSKPIVTSCGSGVTASTIAFALHMIGKDDVAVYDGSWTEWGADETCPIETEN
jgi:thiosulfate/3-mercaptopyruvate sulfurtransferase